MKITDSQPPVSDSNSRTDDADSSKKAKDDGASPFSQLLSKKKGTNAGDDSPSKGAQSRQPEFDPVAAGLIPGQLPKAESPIKTAQVESKQPVTLPVELQQLVREITVGVNAAGRQEVRIEMNSNVLKGLHIQVERKDGAIAIQFQTTSAQVTDLLQRNVAALSQAFSDKGMNEPVIRVNGSGESGQAGDFKNQPQFGGSGQRGNQRGGR
jgi:flagellar hook-length control protein FliK